MADTAQEQSSRRILIVEDHDILRETLRGWIAGSFPQCRLVVTRTGEDALIVCQNEAPDLVLMDIRLPGMDGLQAMGHIRRIIPGAKVVMLTLYEHPALQAAAMVAGADAYVTKARMTRDLLPLLARLLGVRSADHRAAGQPRGQ